MKKFILWYSFAALVFACNQPPQNTNTDKTEKHVIKNHKHGYDSLLAAQLGADDYGMRKYVIAFLKKGDKRPTDSLESLNLQRAHLNNISKLAKEGKLVLAGPFLGNTEIRGIYVFDVQTIEEAKALTQTDPAIQYGSLKMELLPWYGSAALLKLNPIHERIAKINP